MRTLFFIGMALWAFLPNRILAQTPREVMSIVIYEQERAAFGDAFILITHANGAQRRHPLKELIWRQNTRNDPFAENEALITRVFAEYFAQGWEIISVSEKTFVPHDEARRRSFTRYLLARPKTN